MVKRGLANLLEIRRGLKEQGISIGLSELRDMYHFKRAVESGNAEPLNKRLEQAFIKDRARNRLFNELEAFIYVTDVVQNKEKLPERTQWNKYIAGRSILRQTNKSIKEDRLSETYKRKILDVLIGRVFIGGIADRQKIHDEHKEHNERVIAEGHPEKKIGPLTLLTVDPTEACQLKCKDCYEGAYQILFEQLQKMDKAPEGLHQLDLNTLDWVVEDAMKNLGVHLFVLTGGEPTMYWDFEQKKDIFDFCEKWNNKAYFIMYTNALRFNEEIAERIAGIGNIFPSVSVEGKIMEDLLTDERRGKDVGMKVGKALRFLYNAKVPYFTSVTITRKNAEIVSSEEYVKWLIELGAMGSWFFQSAAVNNKFNPDTMVTAEQAVMLRERVWTLMEKYNYPLLDFWSAGDAAATPDAPSGCLAAFRPGGYGSIKSNGQINACVFYPFAPNESHLNNIHEVRKRGLSLVDVQQAQFFQQVRHRQREYQIDPRAPCPFKHGHPRAVDDVDNFDALPYKTSRVLVNGSELSQTLTQKSNEYEKALLAEGVE